MSERLNSSENQNFRAPDDTNHNRKGFLRRKFEKFAPIAAAAAMSLRAEAAPSHQLNRAQGNSPERHINSETEKLKHLLKEIGLDAKLSGMVDKQPDGQWRKFGEKQSGNREVYIVVTKKQAFNITVQPRAGNSHERAFLEALRTALQADQTSDHSKQIEGIDRLLNGPEPRGSKEKKLGLNNAEKVKKLTEIIKHMNLGGLYEAYHLENQGFYMVKKGDKARSKIVLLLPEGRTFIEAEVRHNIAEGINKLPR